jgi:hypothetical protein
MTVFDILNAGGRVILTAIVVFKLTQFRDMANFVERTGLGIMGAGSFLTIPVILFKYDNPFEGWAVSLMTYGVILFLAGRTWRDYKHSRANKIMAQRGEVWLAQRGKP